MESSLYYLPVTKTARFFTLGNLSASTREVWLVLHGYAQLASDFIKPFESIANPERVIVAPEGLNRFYAKGFGGNPVATWMTSESREAEIADYIRYLNSLCDYLSLHHSKAKIVLLGFSQGVATASRWLHQTTLLVSRFIIYSGEIAAELQNPVSPALLSTSLVYVTGNQDKLISAEKLEMVKAFMSQLNAREIVFDGGHEVKAEIILKLV